MDNYANKKRRFEVLGTYSLDGLVMNDKKLFTHAPTGLYEVFLKEAAIEEIQSRKTGTTYMRLALKFQITDGPLETDEKGKWLRTHHNVGRSLGLWTELEKDEEGRPALSPNWWLASAIFKAPGQNLDQKINQWGKNVRWLFVKHRDKRAAKVTGVAYGAKPPALDWVEALST